MEDELRQIYEQRFNRINLGLLLGGLVMGLAILLLADTSSPWFGRAVILLILPLVAWGVRRVSQFVVAASVLVSSLLGLVALSLARPDASISFTPYLFIPVIMSAALLLSPVATAITAAVAIGLTLGVTALTGQLSLANFILLQPPFLIMALVTLLAVEGLGTTSLLGDRLAENRGLLRQRTLELLKALQELDQLGHKVGLLEQQLLQALAESNRATKRADMSLYSLVTGALQELDGSMENLRQLIEQLSQEPAGENQASLLEAAWQQVHYVSRLLIQLDEMAQIDGGLVQLNCQPAEPVRLLQEVTGIARGLVRGKEIEVVYRGPDELPAVPADVARLRQALLQVLSNAVKYTDQGRVEVQAEVSNGELLIFVADTGIGMYPEERQLVFEEFGRGQGTLAQQRHGTGLGLSISRALIELHGGRMWATSALGVGSTFYMALPLEAPEPATLVSSPLRLPRTPAFQAPVPELLDQTVIQRLAPRSPLAARPGFGPVSRLSRSYVNRFAIAAIMLLLLLAATIGVLALSREPVEEDQAEAETPLAVVTVQTPGSQNGPGSATPTAAGQPSTGPAPETVTATPVAVAASPTLRATATLRPEPTSAGLLAPTDTATSTHTPAPSPTPTSTPTSRPSATATLPPTPAPSPTATFTPTSAPSPTASSTPTLAPSPTPTSTSTPAPSPTPTAGPTALPAATSVAVATGAAAPAGLEPGLVYVVEAAGGPQVVRAGSSLDLALAQPGAGLNWSPDGRRLAFTAIENGDLDLFVVETGCAGPDEECDSEAINLTRSAGDDIQPAWSPDGRQLVFSSGRNGNFDLYLLDAACLARPEECAGSERQLTDSQGYEEWPAWSPDGRQLAFVSDVDGNVEIYTSDADGSNPQQVTRHPAADWPVSWSPNGRWLLFASDRDGHWNLYLVAAGCAAAPATCAGQTYRLTDDPADEREPAWSPDGRTIAFASNREGNWDIYTIPAPGSHPAEVPADSWTRVTATPADERYPAWLP